MIPRRRKHIRAGRLPQLDDYERGYLRGYATGVLLVLALLALTAAIAGLLTWCGL